MGRAMVWHKGLTVPVFSTIANRSGSGKYDSFSFSSYLCLNFSLQMRRRFLAAFPFRYLLPVLLCILPFASYSQSRLTGIIINQDITDPRSLKLDLAREGQMDITDLLQKRLSPDSLLRLRKRENAKLGPFFSVIPAIGYAMESGITGVITSSVSFYTSREKNKLSSILINADASQYHQWWACMNSNIYDDVHRLILVGDYRYYKFPTKTFGLGTSSTMGDVTRIDYNYLKISQVVLREITPNVYTGLGYHLDRHFNIREMPDDPGEMTDFKNYGLTKQSTSSALSLNFQFDNRKNSINPKDGLYAAIQYRNNLKVLGSDENWQSIRVDVREYFNMPLTSENVLAFWSYNNITLKGMPPYLDLPMTGWDTYSTTGRGYVPGRYRGQKYIYLESEYRFSILSNGLLGGVVFTNAESMSEWPSNEFRIIAPAGGFGLRIKLNKHSDTNLCIDYGFGMHGSSGFFFNIGEVF